MKFKYRRYLIEPAEGAPQQTVFRPVVPITIHGSLATVRRMALVDTGADFTLLPRSLTTELGIDLEYDKAIKLTGVGDSTIEAVPSMVAFELSQASESVRWIGRAYFATQDYLLLGNEGFLEQYKATFDWSHKTLELLPVVNVPN